MGRMGQILNKKIVCRTKTEQPNDMDAMAQSAQPLMVPTLQHYKMFVASN
jgi:hypothetical protein